MKRPFFGRVKEFAKSGAYLYLPARFVEDREIFPFKDDDIVKLEVVKGEADEGTKMIVSTPRWYELLDWSKMSDAYEKLPPEIKEKIKQSGIMPESD
jgi:hypothetical protein